MTDEQRTKVNVIVHNLYEKTKAGKCDWHKISAGVDSYILKFDIGASIRIHGREKNINLEVYDDNGVKILSFDYKPMLINTTVVKLFDHIKTYHDERTAKILDKLLEDLNNLSKDDKSRPVRDPKLIREDGKPITKRKKLSWKRPSNKIR